MLGLFKRWADLFREVAAATPLSEADHATAKRLAGEAALREGNNLLKLQRLPEAAEYYRRAIALRPMVVDAYVCLGYAVQQLGDLAEATRIMDRALAIAPHHADAHHLRGELARTLRDEAGAVVHFRAALAANPAFYAPYGPLVFALFRQGLLEQALTVVDQGLIHHPGALDLHFYRGNLLLAWGKHTEAASSYRAVLAQLPGHSEASAGLGNCLGQLGYVSEALEQFEHALNLQPDNPAWHSDRLFLLQYQGTMDRAALFEAHHAFASQFEQPLRPQWPRQVPEFHIRQRLKVGYVSGDLRAHSLAYFIEPVLRHHDRNAVEVYCYYTHPVHDRVTARLRELTDHWRSCADLSDEALTQQIRSDGIDVLVDLSGHTAYNRLLVFARKPAPVQVTWLGYQATTGLSAMDYRITDHGLDPIGLTEAYHSEQLMRLSHAGGFQPDEQSPPVNALPCLSRDVFTFGCLNNPAKITPAFLDAVAAILSNTSGTRLLLGNMDEQTGPALLRQFAERGIAPERILPIEKKPLVEYLHLHHDIDLALDTFPYNGGTTTMHSVWMGVPVLALDGAASISRVGASIARGLALEFLVCGSEQEYIARAISLARDTQPLESARKVLRERMAATLVQQAEQLTAEIELRFRRARLQASAQAPDSARGPTALLPG